jgi:DNA (cytosine-5)-methyltransferase 1
MIVGGVFSGIGGLELGFRRAGFSSRFLCEIDADARTVLEARFPDVKLHADINKLAKLPNVDVLVGGFPCQDLSAVGTRLGLAGTQSSLVNRMFDLVESAARRPEWLVLENVPFMLQLSRGRAIEMITKRLEGLGYNWAYRVINSQAFGLPQRRRRVFLVASRGRTAPERVLFADDADEPRETQAKRLARGFYWTEGNTGVGWAVDAIPTLKGGSALSIPSPPAIWTPSNGNIRTPDIRDAERLQGFQANWTLPTQRKSKQNGRRRWRQIGNAVSVPVAAWVAERIARPGDFDGAILQPMLDQNRWPTAACGSSKSRHSAAVSETPFEERHPHLHDFLNYEGAALSERAAAGFFQRVRRTTLKLEEGFLEALAVAAGFDRSQATRVAREPVAVKGRRGQSAASVRQRAEKRATA